MPHDGIVIESRTEALERDVRAAIAGQKVCERKLDHMQAQIDTLQDDIREHLGIAREIIEEQRAARRSRHACVEKTFQAAMHALELLLGDAWVRRGLVVAFLLLAASLAGFSLVQYNGDGLTIGQAPSAEVSAEANRARSIGPAPEP